MENHYISSPVVDLGTVEYLEALNIQKWVVERVKEGYFGDVLIFLDHPPVFTIGRRNIPENYRGVQVVETERGGDVTYHGPGQLVVYPVINLEKNGLFDVRKFVNLMEEIVISSLLKLGYEGKTGEEPGIWVGGKKVASIGIAIRDKISFHGISINVGSEALAGFSRIRPCGMPSAVMGYIPVERELLEGEITGFFNERLHEFRRMSRSEFMNMFLSSIEESTTPH